METLKKHLKGFSWHTAMLFIPFALGFLTDPTIKGFIDQYPKQLGFLLVAGTILGQVSKFINGYYQYKKQLSELE